MQDGFIRTHLPRVGLSVFPAIRPVQVLPHNCNTSRSTPCATLCTPRRNRCCMRMSRASPAFRKRRDRSDRRSVRMNARRATFAWRFSRAGRTTFTDISGGADSIRAILISRRTTGRRLSASSGFSASTVP